METKNNGDEGHIAEWKEIRNRYGVSAHEFFGQFVHDADKHHGAYKITI
ncbi:hypothetical protein [Legionella sp. W05-934-2]|jgi:hypothetical protein